MHPELLFLSGEIALLALLLSALAAAIAWLWRGREVQAARAAFDEEAKARQTSEITVNTLKSALADSEQQCLAALEQRDEAERLSHQRAADIRQLRRDMDESRPAADEREQLRSDYDALRMELAGLQSDLERARAERDRLALAAGEADAKLADQETGRAALQSRVDALVVELSRAEAEVAVRQTELEQASKTASALRLEHEQWQTRALAAEAAGEQSQQQIDALREQIAGLQAQIESLGQAQATAQQTMQSVRAESEAAIRELEHRLATQQSEHQRREEAHAAEIAASAKRMEFLEAGIREGQSRAPEVRAVVHPKSETLTAAAPPAPVALVADTQPADVEVSDAFDVFPSAPDRDARSGPHHPVASGVEPLPLGVQLTQDLAAAEQELSAILAERTAIDEHIQQVHRHEPGGLERLGLARIRRADVEKRLAAATANRDRVRRFADAVSRAEAEGAGGTDDLTRIKGIKGTLRGKLQAHGIRTWRQIAAWSDDDVRTFSELLGARNRIIKDRWREQARELASAMQATPGE